MANGSRLCLLKKDERLACTATTGRPHLAYFVPLAKLADFLAAGVRVKILLADVHAFLDNLKAPFELVELRLDYYERIIRAVLAVMGVPVDRLEFVKGSSYQYSEAYSRDKFRMCAITTSHDALRAGAEVVKQVQSPLLSGLLYPLLQALDEEYLKVDIQFGGVDQRKIFTFAMDALPKIGYQRRIHLMNAMVPSMTAGGKMSSSDPNSKIDFLDSPAAVKKKIKSAYAAPGEVEGNGVLAFCKAVIFPIGELKVHGIKGVMEKKGTWEAVADGAPEGTIFSIRREEKYGGNVHYSKYEDLEADYASQKVFPADLKAGVLDVILALIKPIQEAFEADEAWKKVERAAYGGGEEEKQVKKKEKKYAPKPEWVLEKEKKEKEEQLKKETEQKGDGQVPQPPES
ncbi:tyrosine tRNA ligase [Atractiella rhizophila]|nr:tyrosine tRNA ligase [Atractiella rhizophila]